MIAETLGSDEARVEGDGAPETVPTPFDTDSDTELDGDANDVELG